MTEDDLERLVATTREAMNDLLVRGPEPAGSSVKLIIGGER